MSKVVIEHNPDAARLEELGVASWSTWSKEVSVFPFEFDDQETDVVGYAPRTFLEVQFIK